MLNRVILIGRLTRDPELRKTTSGMAVASFAIAVDDNYKQPDGSKNTLFMSRRAIGISLKKMEYGEYYYHFASTLFGYQYTNKKVQFNAEIARYLFKASNGIPALLVGLFVETQRYAISTGIEELSLGLFEKVFQENFSNMIPFLESQEAKHQPIKETIDLGSENRLVNKMPSLFQKASQNATGEPTGMIMVLKDVISVEYVKL